MKVKLFKIGLIVNLVVSLVCGIGLNVMILSSLASSPIDKFNPYGQATVKHWAKIGEQARLIPKEFYELYGAYTGVNRASAFFSPNIGKLEYNLNLTTNSELIDPLFQSTEGRLRMFTFEYFIGQNLQEVEFRQKIIGTLGKLVFLKHKNINQVDAILKVQEYPSLKEAVSKEEMALTSEEFDIFTICKL